MFWQLRHERIKLRGQWEHSPNVKLAVAPERAVAGDAASRTENHAVTLGSRRFGSGPDGHTRSFESVLGANVDRSRVFLLS